MKARKHRRHVREAKSALADPSELSDRVDQTSSDRNETNDTNTKPSESQMEKVRQLLADLPKNVRAALESRNMAELQSALKSLPQEEGAAIYQLLLAVGIIQK